MGKSSGSTSALAGEDPLPKQLCSISRPSPCSLWQHNVHDAQYHVKQEGESDERWRSDECEQLIDHQERPMLHYPRTLEGPSVHDGPQEDESDQSPYKRPCRRVVMY